MLVPGGDRIGLVEPHAEGDLLPQPLDIRLTEDLLRPALVRCADAAPVDGVLADQRPLNLHHLLRHGAPDTLAVEVREQLAAQGLRWCRSARCLCTNG